MARLLEIEWKQWGGVTGEASGSQTLVVHGQDSFFTLLLCVKKSVCDLGLDQ